VNSMCFIALPHWDAHPCPLDGDNE